MGITVQQILELALSQEGYLEKASPKDEDSMTANAGVNNYTKFGRDLYNNVGSPYSDGVAWCDEFFDWIFWKLGGKQAIIENLYGLSAYTPTSAQYFKNNNAWYTGKSPKPGYQIFFKNSKRICHTGLVVKCENGMVYTIEGNTSSAKGVVANGGCVRQKSYSVAYTSIAGYGIPKCVAGNTSTFNIVTPAQARKAQAKEVKQVQQYINKNIIPGLIKAGAVKDKLNVDGEYGKMTRQAILAYWKLEMNKYFSTTFDPLNSSFGSSCRDASLKCIASNGDKSPAVLITKLLLKSQGFYTGELNDIFDNTLATAVVMFEKERRLIVEPVASAKVGQQVWYAMFN